MNTDQTQNIVPGCRLICDELGCGYTEQVGPIRPSLMGRRCRRCGCNLLTKDDYVAAAGWSSFFRLLWVFGLVRAPREGEGGFVINPKASGVSVQRRTQKAVGAPPANLQQDVESVMDEMHRRQMADVAEQIGGAS